jgi:hypothetical protein
VQSGNSLLKATLDQLILTLAPQHVFVQTDRIAVVNQQQQTRDWFRDVVLSPAM